MTPAEPVAAVPTDAALIAAWRGGDEPAAAELVRRHARALARFLAGAGALEADVDDLVQETFIRAFRAVGRFRGQCQFRTWLMTIGGNVLKDAHRRSRRARVVPLGDDLRATDGDPHERAVAGEAERRLVAGLEQLPRMQREVFLLRIGAGVVALNVRGPQPTTLLPPASAGGELSELSGNELRIVLAALEEPGAERQGVSPQDVGLEDLSALELRALLESLEG